MIEIKPLEDRYIGELVKVEEACFNSGYARETFRKELENKLAVYFAAFEDGKAVGYVGAWNICGEAEIINIGVLPELRRRGIGARLMKVLIAELEGRGSEAVHLEVRESNSAARSLYEGLGFQYDGMRKGYYDGKEDACLMTRRCSSAENKCAE